MDILIFLAVSNIICLGLGALIMFLRCTDSNTDEL